MGTQMVDVTMHIDEETTHDDREQLRNRIMQKEGVVAAIHHDDKPHFMIIEYDPETINASEFPKIAMENGLHTELIGL